VGAVEVSHDSEEPNMQSISTIGLDIAKSVFQVHGVDDAGEVVIRRQLKRRYVLAFFQKLPPCLVGIEACASSHYWSRELKGFGHTVQLMPPAYAGRNPLCQDPRRSDAQFLLANSEPFSNRISSVKSFLCSF
jgi:transposase